MSVTADKTAGTAANADRGASFVAWATITNTVSSNNVYATCSLTIGGAGIEFSDYLRLTNFGLTAGDIPVGSIIDGIEVIIERKANVGSSVDDTHIILRKTSGQVGNNKQGSFWPTSDTDATYGGSTDLWGTDWEQEDLVSTNFGLDIAISGSGSEFDTLTGSIDFVRLRIYYTAPVAVPVSDSLAITVDDVLVVGATALVALTDTIEVAMAEALAIGILNLVLVTDTLPITASDLIAISPQLQLVDTLSIQVSDVLTPLFFALPSHAERYAPVFIIELDEP